MWVVPFISSGGDEYLVGPFDHKPTQEEILALLREWDQEETDLSIELDLEFRSIKLSKKPKVVEFYM